MRVFGKVPKKAGPETTCGVIVHYGRSLATLQSTATALATGPTTFVFSAVNSEASNSRMHAHLPRLVSHVMGKAAPTSHCSVGAFARPRACVQIRRRLASTSSLTPDNPGPIRFKPKAGFLPPHPARLHGCRQMAWLPKLNAGLRPQQEQFNGPSDNQEEAAKVAMLEKAMKGRQPTDLKLRCKFRP